MGFLAASPVNPATAISFSLLHSIHEIWRKSPFGVEGFVEGIWAIHASRGGVVLALNAYKVSCNTLRVAVSMLTVPLVGKRWQYCHTASHSYI